MGEENTLSCHSVMPSISQLFPNAVEMINSLGWKPEKSWKEQKYFDCNWRAHKLVTGVMRKLLACLSLAAKYFIYICGFVCIFIIAMQRVSSGFGA